jgi:siderophore synthetase component
MKHLNPSLWAVANRLLVRKALAEFAHERLLTPVPSNGLYVLASDDGATTYRFAATRLALDHWEIDADSIARTRGSADLPIDALDFFLELRGALGLSDEILPVYLEEIGSTLSGLAYKLSRPFASASALASADFQDIESGMTEGHPCFVANNGRLGFGIDDYHRYAPEAAQRVHLIWLAAHRDHSTFTSTTDIDYDGLVRAEFSPSALAGFASALSALDLSLDDYHLFPVHPWQWENKISVTFAGEVAARRLVYLGPSPDEYQAQQSIRTFFNVTTPARHYVKTAISVLNMGFVRGLSAAYMEVTPAINDWLADLIAADDVFKSTRLSVLRERAAIGYHHRHYEAATDRYSPYRKMLAALWRESPVPSLARGERLATMASLLHVDSAGDSVAAALIRSSGLTASDWLRRYLDAYLVPLLHAFYAYDLAFMPHGENTILVLRDGVVERTIFKDLAEEIVVMSADVPLPAQAERVRATVPEHMKLLSIFTDVFDCFFRFLSAILHTRGVLDEDAFWQLVAECAHDYRDSVPHLASRFERYDLFAPTFALSCLNRLQLRNNRQMVDLADPSAALQLVGDLENPLARFTGSGG